MCVCVRGKVCVCTAEREREGESVRKKRRERGRRGRGVWGTLEMAFSSAQRLRREFNPAIDKRRPLLYKPADSFGKKVLLFHFLY